MSSSRRVLITGAAGNLGSRLVRRLAGEVEFVRAMIHRRPLPDMLASAPGVEPMQADLARPETLPPCLDGVDTIVHFAGVLFRARPERFLPRTNTRWFSNLLDAALAARVSRVILISFPHVEGLTTTEHPATDRLDGQPLSVHARTRLEEERVLYERTRGTQTTPVVLRSATIYGKGVLMVEAARRLARLRLLGVWREPTCYHFLQIADFIEAAAAAVVNETVRGTYGLGDEQPMTIQQFLDGATGVWGLPRPWRLPWWVILAAATASEAFAGTFRTVAPLTRDFVRLGRVPHCCDTRRMRSELLPQLKYPTFATGKETLG
jgi:nucleoside-diphosphate-sugar epimerase